MTKATVVNGMRGTGAAAAQALGKGMLGVGAVAVAGLSLWGLKLAAGFDDAMTKSLAIQTGITEDMRSRMEKTAREVARTTTFSANEAAEAYFFLASAGLAAEAQLAALPRVAAFAQAGNFDLAKATDLLTDAQSALGLTVRDDAVKNLENMNRVSDVLVKANSLSNATVREFSESLTGGGAAALRSFNKDVEEGVAVLAAYADQGTKGAAAGGALDRMMRLLPDAAIKNADAYKRMGIDIFDAQGSMENFADIIGDMERAFEGLSDRQKQQALQDLGFNARVQGIIKPLLGTSEAIREYEAQLRLAGGTTDQVAGKQLKSFSAKLSILKAQFADIALTLGVALLPVLESMVDFITPIASGIADFASANEHLMRTLGPIISGLSTLLALKFAGGFVKMLMPIPPGMLGGIPGMSKLGTAFGTKFGSMFSVAALAMMGVVIVQLWKDLENVAAEVDRETAELEAKKKKIAKYDTMSVDEMKKARDDLVKLRQEKLGGGPLEWLLFDVADVGGVRTQFDESIAMLEQEIEDARNGLRSSAASNLVPMEDLIGVAPVQPNTGRFDAIAEAGAFILAEVAKVRRKFGQMKITDTFLESWRGGMRGLRHEFVSQSMELIQTINGNWERIQSAIDNPPKLKSRGQRIKDYQKAITDVDKNLKKALKKGDDINIAYWATMKVDAVQSLKEYKNTGGQTAQEIIARFKSMNMKVPKWLRQMATTAKKKSGETKRSVTGSMDEINTNLAAQNWLQYGAHAVDTLIAGMDSKHDSLVAASDRVAAAAAESIEFSAPPRRGALSKVRSFMPHMIDQLVAGGDEALGKAGRFSDRLASGLSPAMAGGTASIGGRGGGSRGGGDVHIHIGTLVANDAGLDELNRRITKRLGLKDRNRWSANEAS